MYTRVYGQEPASKKRMITSKSSTGGTRKVSQQMIQRIPRNIISYNKPNLNELKYADIALNDDNFNVIGTWSPQLLNGLTQGSAQQQRIGNKIAMKSVRIRGQIVNLTTNVQTYARIIVFYDKQTNGALCANSDLLQTTTTTPANTTTAFSELNLNNVERFVILRDYCISLPSVTNTAGVLTNVGFDPGQNTNNGSIFEVDMFIKLKGLQTLYKDATALIGGVSTGGLFMVLINHQGVAAWTFRHVIRLRYDDN